MTINFDWLRKELQDGFYQMLEKADPLTEDDQIEEICQKIRHRFMDETNQMLNRIQKASLNTIDREREEVD